MLRVVLLIVVEKKIVRNGSYLTRDRRGSPSIKTPLMSLERSYTREPFTHIIKFKRSTFVEPGAKCIYMEVHGRAGLLVVGRIA